MIPTSAAAATGAAPAAAAYGGRKTSVAKSATDDSSVAPYSDRNDGVRTRARVPSAGAVVRGFGRAPHGDRAQEQEHPAHQAEHDVRLAPPVRGDERGGERRADQGADPDPGHGDGERDGSASREPAADGGHERHVTARDSDAHPEAVGEVAQPQPFDGGGEQQACGERGRRSHQERPRPDPVGDAAGDGAEQEPACRGHSEHEGRGAVAGAELRGHRREERPEAVGHGEHHCHRDERGGDGDPPPRRVENRARPGLRCHAGSVRRVNRP